MNPEPWATLSRPSEPTIRTTDERACRKTSAGERAGGFRAKLTGTARAPTSKVKAVHANQLLRGTKLRCLCAVHCIALGLRFNPTAAASRGVSHAAVAPSSAIHSDSNYIAAVFSLISARHPALASSSTTSVPTIGCVKIRTGYPLQPRSRVGHDMLLDTTPE